MTSKLKSLRQRIEDNNHENLRKELWIRVASATASASTARNAWAARAVFFTTARRCNNQTEQRYDDND